MRTVDELLAESFRKRYPRHQRRTIKTEEAYVMGLKEGWGIGKKPSPVRGEARRWLRDLREDRRQLREMIS